MYSSAYPAPPAIGLDARSSTSTDQPATDDSMDTHDQINAMMEDLAYGNEATNEVTVEEDDREPTRNTSHTPPMPLTPISNKTPRQRDLSDRTLVDALRTDSATCRLIREIIRICWKDDLQHRLVLIAVIIHKDLRKCFHSQKVTHDTSRRAGELATSVDEVLNAWAEHMMPLQQAIDSIDVVKDTPNLVDMAKEKHGPAMKVFSKVLLPIPTEAGAECNSRVVKMMKELFDNEVRLPFEQLLSVQRSTSPAEITARGYLVVLNKSFIRISEMADLLRTSTNGTWVHWKQISEKIAKQAETARTHKSAALTQRAKSTMSRMLSRSHTKRNRITHNDDGHIKISSPLETITKLETTRRQPRDALVRDTTVEIPRHPLDAAPEDTLLEDLVPDAGYISALELNTVYEDKDGMGPFTPHTQFSPRHPSNSFADVSKDQAAVATGTEDDPFIGWDNVTDNRAPTALGIFNSSPPPDLTLHSGLRPASSPYRWSTPFDATAQNTTASHPDSRPPSTAFTIDGARYYNMLREFYRMDPDKPEPGEDPDLYSMWYRAHALRRLEEGGTPADTPNIQFPTDAMVSIQRAHEKKHEKKRMQLHRAQDALVQERRKLDELDVQLKSAMAGRGAEVAGVRLGVDRDMDVVGREKRALRESLSPYSAGSDGQRDLARKASVARKSRDRSSTTESQQTGSSQGDSSKGVVVRRESRRKAVVRPDQDGVDIFLTRQGSVKEEREDEESARSNSLVLDFVFPPRAQNNSARASTTQRSHHSGPISLGQTDLNERGASGIFWYNNLDEVAESYITDEEEPWRLDERAG
ncbi:hypothetical protein MPH_12038 [Macrophomina phaseolina MS6]|uniref:Uncharacterized protein n=1 Tax=Macrophomina phaseolina (strain MS6) TaxID=1126212 RepID=K2S2Y7_MACPH|nr:hypothetical protein MPH_12038 [Macrophomina phaseolina MS6]